MPVQPQRLGHPPGNRTAKQDDLAGVTSNYTYDKIYELTQVLQGANTTESYSYDAVGNRTASLGIPSYTTNSSNEMTANSNASYTYDNNGNTTSKINSSGTTSYTWDYENRLTSVTLPGTGGTVTFEYDPFGRRIEKISPTTTSMFAYDGDNLIETVNASGAEVASYAQGTSIDEPLAMDRSGTVDYYEQDGLGSVTSLTNAAGTVAQSYTYDSFGNTTNSNGSLTNFFQYTGREFDTETELYYYRARYYDPPSGRFLREDPVDFDGDSSDFYLYASNDPTSFVDPLGTSSQPPSPLPPEPGPDQQHGGFTYNQPPPGTGLLHGEALGLANCMANCLAPTHFVVSGGSECTPDGRHVSGGALGSKHCTNQAFDMHSAGMNRKKTFCCALQCGVKFIKDEGTVWHFQTVPGRGNSHGLLPKPCDCK